MPSLLCALFIVYLFWADSRAPGRPSAAQWIPLCWMFIAGSRYVSTWLGLRPVFTSANEASGGSPIDAGSFFALIVLGAIVLSRRRIDWNSLIRNNIFIFAYFGYCLISVAWTDDVALLLKRWVKDLGNPIMALVILTEARPYESAGTALRRLTFLLIPLSFLFAKYIPDLGRAYHADGSPMYTGAGSQKNDLGLICLISGVALVWDYFYAMRAPAEAFAKTHKLASLALLAMTLWLLRLSDSQTATVCFTAACVLLALGRMPGLLGKADRLFGLVGTTLVTLGVLDELVGLKEFALGLVGRNPTLTSRTDIWATVLKFETNPLLGTGFMSFWSGARQDEIQTQLGATITQAHNGYLEQYLNLGYIGVGFIAIVLISGLISVRRQMAHDAPAAMLRFCFIVIAILYNFTEASFYGINNMWLMLLLGCFDVPTPTARSATLQTAQAVRIEPHVRFPRRLGPRRPMPTD